MKITKHAIIELNILKINFSQEVEFSEDDHMDSNRNHSKIVELIDTDDDSCDEFDDCDESLEDVQLKFKQSFLKNRR